MDAVELDKAIRDDLLAVYGIRCEAAVPVDGGWLNRKWRVSGGGCDALVKAFSAERYNRTGIAEIERALGYQAALSADGVPCPRVWTREGRAIRHLADGTAYAVMDFCPGWVESPDTVTLAQMKSLGDAGGRMKKAFARIPAEGAKGYPFDGGQVLDALRKNLAECRAAGVDAGAQEPILEFLDCAFLDSLPKAIAHEDFSGDNLLFLSDHLSAIVDFDRARYGFMWHDVGRILLSLALDGENMRIGRVRAFMDGFGEHLPLSLKDVENALRVAWCVETPWWINPAYITNEKPKIARFRREMQWLTKNWFSLDKALRT